jgi:hypothetical protein
MSAPDTLQTVEARPPTSAMWRKGSLTPPCLTGAIGHNPPLTSLERRAGVNMKAGDINIPDYPEGSASLRSRSGICGVRVATYPRRGIIAGSLKRRLNR